MAGFRYRGVEVDQLPSGWYYARTGQGVARKTKESIKNEIDRRKGLGRKGNNRPRVGRVRRQKARENPGAGFWIAVGVGAVAVGGVIYVMTRPSTAAASTTPPQPQINPPTNDAATFKAPVTITFPAPPFNGAMQTRTVVPNPANVASDVLHAHRLAAIGHGSGKEGDLWAQMAVADGANAAQLSQLRSDGYAV
jgi:hypothetical protein